MIVDNAKSLLRYQRQMILPEIGTQGQEKLSEARVLVVGAGGLGCPVLTYLVAAGVGTIKIVDPDNIEFSNLHRQPIFCPEEIGQSKAEIAKKWLNQHNPETQMIVEKIRLQRGNVEILLSDVDIVVDCTDNFATKYLLNDACVMLGKTLVSSSIYQFEGQLSVYNAQLPNKEPGPTYRCLYPNPPLPEMVPSCVESGVLGILPGVMGTLQATEVIKLITGIGELLIGRLLVFDALTLSFSEFSFGRNDAIVAQTKLWSASDYDRYLPLCEQSSQSFEITPQELKEKLANQEDMLLIDLRADEEKCHFSIAGKQMLLDEFLWQREKVPFNTYIVLYCSIGDRSRQVALQLRHQGFFNVVSLSGGINAWQAFL